MTGKEKMEKAAADPNLGMQAKAIAEYLLDKCRVDAGYDSLVAAEGRTLDRCLEYIYYQAANQNKKREGMMMFGQDTVYGWADDYFGLDDNEEKKTVKAAHELMQRLVSGRNSAQTAAQSEKKPEKAAGKETIGKQKAKAEPEVKPDEKKKETKPDKKREKKPDGMDGQMSLFDLMGGAE